jgi:hypothetical protein
LKVATEYGFVKILSVYICLKKLKNNAVFVFKCDICFVISCLLRGIVAFGQIL